MYRWASDLAGRSDADAPEHGRGHGALYDGLGSGRIDLARLSVDLARVPLPRTRDGRIVLAVDVSPWLRSDAATSAERLFCHVYGRARSVSRLIPGWPYSFVVALESGRTSWTAPLDVVRLGTIDDPTAVTADQLRGVVERLITAGYWTTGDPDIVIVMDSGYDVTRVAFVLADHWADSPCNVVRRADTGEMAGAGDDQTHGEPGTAVNIVRGDVSGSVVQAGVIAGGVHFYSSGFAGAVEERRPSRLFCVRDADPRRLGACLDPG